MEKLKRNAGLKVAAVIVLAVSMVAFAVSGVLGLALYGEGAFKPGGTERIKDNIIENISWHYIQDALAYYSGCINNEYVGSYEKEFSSQNTNFSFKIEPVGTEDEDLYPKLTLTNYECSDYQYSGESIHNVEINDIFSDTFQFPISKDEIKKNAKYIQADQVDDYYNYYDDDYYDTEDYYEDDYGEEDYNTVAPDVTEVAVNHDGRTDFYVESQEGGSANIETADDDMDFNGVYNADSDLQHYILFHKKAYKLEDNEDFVNQYNEFIDGLPKNAAYSYTVFYNAMDECYTIVATAHPYIQVKLSYKVRSNLVAYDDYYTSVYLNYADVAIKAVVPTIIVSFVLIIILGGYLIAVSGHRKGQEEISLNSFDKIPYDILAVFLIGAVVLTVFFLSEINGENELFIIWGGLFWLVCVYFITVVMTTATRMKCKGWSCFSNMIIYRFFRWLLRLIACVCKKIFGGISYLWRHLGIYWKYIGLFLAVGLVEVFAAAAEGANITFMLLILEKLLFGFALIFAIINIAKLKEAVKELAKGHTDYKVNTDHMQWTFKEDAENLNKISDGIQLAVEERMKSERMKTELITNVSHDIKTPLTSIISYVDLLEKEELENDKANEYLEVLDRQSARLKKLIQDLIDASKASTGNIPIELTRTDVRVLLEQAMGELAENLEKRELKVNISYNTDNTVAMADGKQLWRVFANLINNICKYAQENSRVYIDVTQKKREIIDEGNIDSEITYSRQENVINIVFKNISAEALNITGEELMERFVRGDSSRNTEGSGLGLSIAKSLMELMHGSMELIVDGDLFKVILSLVAE